MNKYELIVTAEKQFAREVTLGVIVQQPLSVWHTLIPGMFIFDFLRRSSAISRYTRHFMFPRELAIDAAQRLRQGYEKADLDARLTAEIESWLHALDLYSQQLAQAQKRAVDVLIGHYTKLMDARGNDYNALIRNAYVSKDAYQAHVRELLSAEKEIDRAIIAQMRDDATLKGKIELEAQQVAIRRQKILETIF